MATQPGTGLTLFGQPAGALPAHMTQFLDEVGTNVITRGQTVPSLSPGGKTWTISVAGVKQKLQRRNADGDMEPLPIMKVVVLNWNQERGRSYYEGEYDPENASAPICWSDDGVAPDASLPGPFAAGQAVEPGTSRKISATCANCPMAVKGSKVTPQGKSVTACSQHRMLAVVPDPALGLKDVPPLRLKIAMTSDWDKNSPDQEQQGWLAWSNYVDWLNARGCKHTALIVTKMKFDPEATYPKIFFSAERPLEANELAAIAPLAKSDDVKKLLGGTWTPAGSDGVPKDQQDTAQAAPAREELSVAPEPVMQVTETVTPQASGAPAGFKIVDGDPYTYEQYVAGGWTDDVLKANGKLIAVAAPAPAPEVVATPAPPPAAPAPVVETAIVIEEPAAPATPTTSAPSQPAAPAPEQAPAQAAVPPAPAAPAPQPAAAAAVAAEATPAVSTDVPKDVEDLLAEWG